MAVLSRRRQPVDHFIARKPFYRPQWPFYQGQCTFIKPKQPVNHFIARRPFNMAANGRFMKPRQLVDHFIARRPFYRPKAARRPFYRPRWPFYQGQWQFYRAKAARWLAPMCANTDKGVGVLVFWYVPGRGSGLSGSGFRFKFAFRVRGFGSTAAQGFKAQGAGFRLQGFRLQALWGLGFGV